MTRLTLAIFAVASVAFAQGRLNPAGTTGNVLHPGIPSSGPPPGSPRMNVVPGTPTFAPAPRGGGFRQGGGFGRNGFGRSGATVIVPYPIAPDAFYGGGNYGGGGMFYQPQPGYYDPIWGIYNPGTAEAPFQAQQQPQSPTVVINQNFQPETARPVLRDYSNVQLPDPSFRQVTPPPQPQAAPAGNDQPTIYLIALKDHTIIPVLGYWMDKGALSYVTVDSVIGRVPLDQVDREFSQKLNDDRHIEFRLPSVQ